MDLVINDVNLDLARQMLTFECDLRKSTDIQNMYTLVQTGQIRDLELIEDYVQYMTIKEFGMAPTLASLRNYRLISRKFGDQIFSYAFYLKYNIMQPQLMPGTLVDTSDVKIINYASGDVVDFPSTVPSLIFSGSLT